MPEIIPWEDEYLTLEIERNFFNDEDEDDDFIRDLCEELWEEDDYE